MGYRRAALKTKRIVDLKLLRAIRELPCLACDGAQQTETEPDHVKTRGSGGNDSAENVWPLCRQHHCDRHLKGLRYMTENFEKCFDWMKENQPMFFERGKK